MVAIVMGSISDWEIMQQAEKILVQLNIPYSKDVVSAHRTPQKMFDFAQNAQSNGIKVIIAGAGGAAHLPGMIASITPLPVIGVPVKSSNSLDGWDSLLSIVQMPNGVPVATVGVNAAQNAGIIAAQILALSDAELMKKLIAFKAELKEKVNQASEKLKNSN
jgi:5-(carboxyamino)imidazole ribonucleotide mutase